MAETPAAPHRTTGSTLLHPLSALLGIPLDQVSGAELREGFGVLGPGAAGRQRASSVFAAVFLRRCLCGGVFVAVPRQAAGCCWGCCGARRELSRCQEVCNAEREAQVLPNAFLPGAGQLGTVFGVAAVQRSLLAACECVMKRRASVRR